MKIERVKKLPKEEFFTNYLLKNTPVIITDAMDNWDIKRFQPESLKKEFGSEFTQVYNDLFDLQNVASLENYLNTNFSKPEKKVKEYVRWYTKLKDVDFLWSDSIFEKLQDAWNHPYFLPKDFLLMPPCHGNQTMDITKNRFPYKGLFISGKGARTRLHRDPFNSNAVLCQFYGEKEIYLYAPDQEKYVMNEGEFVNIINPDMEKFPNFSEAEPTYHLILEPGEIILFPAGWFHDVTSVSDSISVTWNFVHAFELENFQSFIKENPEDDQLEIVRFFLKDHLPSDASVEAISLFLETHFGTKTV